MTFMNRVISIAHLLLDRNDVAATRRSRGASPVPHATRELVAELGTTRAAIPAAVDWETLAMRVPEQRRGDTDLFRELVRRQAQRREYTLRCDERR